MMLKNFKFYDPDDTGGQGDETPKPTQIDAVKAVADGIKAAIEAARIQPAPVAQVPQTDPRAALEAEATKINEQYDALMADGKFAEAANLRDGFKLKVSQSTQVNADDDPLVKTAMQLGKKSAKLEYGDVMTKWGSEVEAIVKALPVQERIQPDAWDRAVSQVKTNHFQEILDAEVETRINKGGFIAPGAQAGSRGKKQSDSYGLNEAELMACETTGVSPEAYAKRVKEAEAYDAIPLRQRGHYEGYPVVSNTVVPGKF